MRVGIVSMLSLGHTGFQWPKVMAAIIVNGDHKYNGDDEQVAEKITH